MLRWGQEREWNRYLLLFRVWCIRHPDLKVPCVQGLRQTNVLALHTYRICAALP